MIMDKVKELKALLGGGPEAEKKVDQLLETAQAVDKAAEQAGLAYKEQKPEEKKPELSTETKEQKITDQPGMFVSDMKPEEFDQHVKATVDAAVKPFMDELKAMKEANTQAVKEASASVLAVVVGELKNLHEAQTKTDKQVQELNGLTPRGFRASHDPTTVTDSTKEKKPGPAADEKKSSFEEMVDFFVGKPSTQN